MAVSLSLLAILLVAMGGAVTIAAKSLPSPNSPVAADLALSTALDRLSGELRYAKTIESSSPTAVQFLVADRDSNSSDERIRYEWLGPAHPLTRSYNGGTAVAISDALSSFSLAYQNKKVTTTQSASTVVDSGEVLFSSCGWTGLVPIQSNGTLTATAWTTCYFKLDNVSIPNTSNYVAITKVRVKLKRASSPTGATITVGIYNPAAPGGPAPSTTQIGSSSSITSASLTTSYPSTFIDFPFTDVTFATPPTELNFVVKGTGTSCGSMMFMNNTLAPANNPAYMYTSSSGATWNPTGSLLNQNDGVFEVYGVYRSTTNVVQNTDTYYLHSFSVAADLASPAIHAATTTRAMNQPTVVGP
jgi:hypothetical protein